MIVNAKECSAAMNVRTLSLLQAEFGSAAVSFLPNETFLLVSAEHDEIIGTICIDLQRIPPCICNFTVLPQFRNLGNGTRMIQYIHTKLACIGMSMVNLACRDDKLSFYKNLGYIRTGSIPTGDHNVYNLMTFYVI